MKKYNEGEVLFFIRRFADPCTLTRGSSKKARLK
jgi:hypothetical protein